MKIAIVSQNFSSTDGGAAAIAFDQARALSALGQAVFVFTGASDSVGWSQKNKLRIYRVRTKEMPWLLRSYFCLRNFRIEYEFKKFLKKIQPDVVHFHNLYYHLPFSLIKIAGQLAPKVFFTAHDVMTFSQHKLTDCVDKKYNLKNIDQINYTLPLSTQIKWDKKAFNPLRNFFIRRYLKCADKIFSVSHELKKALEQNGIRNIKVIHNGIDVNNWQADKKQVEELRSQYNLQGKKVILFAGRISAAKGRRQLIAAMDIVEKQHPETKILVLDSTAKINNDLLAENFILAQPVTRAEMKNYYSLSDIIVVPSICFDSFPTVNLEAMACARPAIATIFGGSREIVEHNKTGYLVNPLNINDLAGKIIYLLNYPDVARQMGERGYAKVKQEFNTHKWLGEILSWYTE